MNKFDYQLLTNKWEGVKGAAWNATAEFCIEEGWMDFMGMVTPEGYEAIERYEQTTAHRPKLLDDKKD